MTKEELEIELNKIKEEIQKLYEVVMEYVNSEKLISRR